MNTTGVRGELRDMWETRPARPRDDRQIAGVAAAVARRYDIDPVLVRVGFAASAFFGIGAALYFLGWLVLPDTPPDPAVAEPRRRGILVVGLVIATVISVGTVFGGRGGVLVPLLVTLGLLYLLHHSRAGRGLPGSGRAGVPGVPEAPTGGVSLVKGTTRTTDEQVPPSWDPLGAAPFAWDLPEPGPVPGPAPRRRPPVTAVTLGLALLAGAATIVVLLATGAIAATVATPILLGVVLSVVGLGLVFGAFVHAGRGLIPFAILGSLLAWLALSAPLDRFAPGDFGDIREAPTTVGQLQSHYQRGVGDVTLDLRGLDLSAPVGSTAATAPTTAARPGPASAGPGGPAANEVRTSVETGAGDITVLLPPAVDVRFHGESGLGDVSFGSMERSGPGAELVIPDDLGYDGVQQGRLLVIDVRSGAGDVEVRRG